MSIKVHSTAWELSSQKGGELLTLLAIADMANDNGYAWPGVGAIMKKNRMSKRQTLRMLQHLEEIGELFINKRPGKSSRYIVLLGTSASQFVDEATEKFKMNEGDALDAYWNAVNKQQVGSGDKMAPAGDIMTPAENSGDKMAPADSDDSTGGQPELSTTPDKMAPVTQLGHRGGDIAMAPDPLRSNKNGLVIDKSDWSLILETLQVSMDKTTFALTFKNSEVAKVEEGGLVVLDVNSQQAAAWINERNKDIAIRAIQLSTEIEEVDIWARPKSIS